MAKFIIAFQIILNLSGVGFFMYGWYFNNLVILIIGGTILILDDVLTVYSGAMNIIGPTIAWIIVAIFISPWWYSLFWSSLIFNILGVPGSIIKIFTFKQRVQRLEEAQKYSNL